MSNKGILLFGGTFDPIHNGHLIIAESAAEKLGVEKVVLIPSANPPHKNHSSLTPIRHRLAMTRLAVAGNELFEVSDCELKRDGPSFTFDTVRYFREQNGPNIPLYWLIGGDTIKELACWYKVEQLVDECTIVTAGRPNCDMETGFGVFRGKLSDEQIARLKQFILETPLVDISATQIRSRIRRGQDISDLTPLAVQDYIIENKLYKT
ncbi:MAG: nicotinate (nicotinamide) nucleotide adenylyltransferase [Sedimentisphaerales bacterium]|nr:nicotinate (nicotinamide) nucleotide adenylyltransferase [Sedimentisphaerales bacterium]